MADRPKNGGTKAKRRMEMRPIRLYLDANKDGDGEKSFFGHYMHKQDSGVFVGKLYVDLELMIFLRTPVSDPLQANRILDDVRIVGASISGIILHESFASTKDEDLFCEKGGTYSGPYHYFTIWSNNPRTLLQFLIRFYPEFTLKELPEKASGYRKIDLDLNRPTLWDVLGNTFPRIRKLIHWVLGTLRKIAGRIEALFIECIRPFQH